MSMLIWTLLACDISRNTSGLTTGDSGDQGDCLVHFDRQVEGVTCTLIEHGDGTSVVWYGQDVDAEHLLTIRLRTDAAEVASVLVAAAAAWNQVLADVGVLLAYESEDLVDPFTCALETLEDQPEQVAGFCVATPDEWSEHIDDTHQEDAYVTRLNSPCDGTLRGSMTVLHPLWAGDLTEQAIAKALGHLTSVVAIDDDDALMADHWDGLPEPKDTLEGVCAAWQYRDMEG